MKTKQRFAKIMMRAFGWKAMDGVIPEPKGIILGVPHTSIMDFIISWFYYTSVGGTPNIMVKKEFFFWPLGYLMKAMGAVPVDRSKGATAAVHCIEAMQKADRMHLAIAPEGTRKFTPKWKKGFYTIAQECNVPVYMGYFDWKRKQIGRGEKFELTGNVKEDINKMRAHYRAMGIEGKYKDCYTFDDI